MYSKDLKEGMLLCHKIHGWIYKFVGFTKDNRVILYGCPTKSEIDYNPMVLQEYLRLATEKDIASALAESIQNG